MIFDQNVIQFLFAMVMKLLEAKDVVNLNNKIYENI